MAVGTTLGGARRQRVRLRRLRDYRRLGQLCKVAGFIVRGADSAVLRVKNIKMTCPHCHERITTHRTNAPPAPPPPP